MFACDMSLLDIISTTVIQVLTPSTVGLNATNATFLFEQRLHTQHLPPVSVVLEAVDFARAIVGESVDYKVYGLTFSVKLSDGLYTLPLLNMELVKGFVNNSHQSNIPSDDVDVFSAPGGEVFTSTFTRRRLSRASPMSFIVASHPSLVSTDNLMYMTLQIHDRSGKTIFGLTRALSNGMPFEVDRCQDYTSIVLTSI